MRIIVSATCLALIVSGTVVAQVTHPPAAGPGIGNPAGTAPGTRDENPGKPPRQSNLADRAFALTAASGGLAEVELANLAQQVSHSDAIKAFARQMVQDHSKANRKLTEIGAQQSIPLAHDLDAEHRQAQAHLATLHERQFDAEYLLLQQQDHQRTAQLLEYEIGSGENAALQTFAVETLPVVLRHLAMVQDLMEQFAQQNVTAGVAPPKGSGMPTPQTPNTPKN
jgi:putative membrane protein